MAAVGIISMPASPHELANSTAGAACLAAAAAVSDGIAAVAAATTFAAAQCSTQVAACSAASSAAISRCDGGAVCSIPSACNPAAPVHVFSHIVAPALVTSQTAAPVLATSHTAAPALVTSHIAAPHRHHHAQRLAKHDCAHGPIARLPPHLESLGIDAQLAAVQRVISSFTYNMDHRSDPHYDTDKTRPYRAIMATAAGMLTHPQHIKCLEAVMLALHLTNAVVFAGSDRIPVGFKTTETATGHEYRHIVLAVRHGGAKWGALGLSREEGLQWKLLAFGSLGALLSDYREAYRRCGHEVTKVRIGLPMPHDGGYKGKVVWRALKLRMGGSSWLELCADASPTTVLGTQHAVL